MGVKLHIHLDILLLQEDLGMSPVLCSVPWFPQGWSSLLLSGIRSALELGWRIGSPEGWALL